MKNPIMYTVTAAALAAVAAIAIVGCDGDFGERSENMDDFLDKFHYNKKPVKKCTVTYDGNYNTDGKAPEDDKSPYDSGTVIDIKDHGNLVKDGYRFFRWNLQKDGKGQANYKANDRFPLTNNVTFYAQWDNSIGYLVEVTSLLTGTYVSGGGTYRPDETVTIIAGAPTAGWRFQNWTTTNRNVSFADATSDTTTFIMPESKVTVTATFVATGGTEGWLTDERDGKTYITVTIGEQTWITRNLDYLNNMTTGDSSWCYDNEPDNCSAYGRLYTWNAAMSACPAGWRLPDTADWNRLVVAAGGGDVADKKLKSKTGWDSGNGTDDYVFSALPGGTRNSDGGFSNAGYYGNWWAATERNASYAYYRFMVSIGNNMYSHNINKGDGFSVRCVGN
jgi:uncharacterized protein (TIGR02145 family)